MRTSAGIWGHHRYADAFPNRRWASQGGVNGAQISLEGDEFLIAPLKVFGRLLRMPEVRIPVSAVVLALEIGGGRGVRFVTPTRPELDGTCFKANSQNGGHKFLTLVQESGIPIRRLSRSERVVGFGTDMKAQQKSGLRWIRRLLNRSDSD